MTNSSQETSDALIRLARHSRTGAILTIVGAVVLTAVLAYSSYELANLQKQTAALAARRAELTSQNQALETKLNAARLTIARARGIEANCSELRSFLTASGSLNPGERKLLEQSARSAFLIGVFGSGVDSNEVRLIGGALERDGYTVKFANTWPGTKPQWFASEPTVLYYSPKTADVATTIAAQLSDLTGKRFQTRLGAGFDVPRDQKGWILYVHDVPSGRAQLSDPLSSLVGMPRWEGNIVNSTNGNTNKLELEFSRDGSRLTVLYFIDNNTRKGEYAVATDGDRIIFSDGPNQWTLHRIGQTLRGEIYQGPTKTASVEVQRPQ